MSDYTCTKIVIVKALKQHEIIGNFHVHIRKITPNINIKFIIDIEKYVLDVSLNVLRAQINYGFAHECMIMDMCALKHLF